jgi:hypothetical protein
MQVEFGGAMKKTKDELSLAKAIGLPSDEPKGA